MKNREWGYGIILQNYSYSSIGTVLRKKKKFPPKTNKQKKGHILKLFLFHNGKFLSWRPFKEGAVVRTIISVIRTNTCWTPQKMQKQNMFTINNLCEIYGLLCIHWVIQSSWLFFSFPFLLCTAFFFHLTSSFYYLSIRKQSCLKTLGRELLPLLAWKAPEYKNQTKCELSVCAYGLSIVAQFLSLTLLHRALSTAHCSSCWFKHLLPVL